MASSDPFSDLPHNIQADMLAITRAELLSSDGKTIAWGRARLEEAASAGTFWPQEEVYTGALVAALRSHTLRGPTLLPVRDFALCEAGETVHYHFRIGASDSPDRI